MRMVLLSGQSTGTISAKLIEVTNSSNRLRVSEGAWRGNANPCALPRDMGKVLEWPIEMRVFPCSTNIGQFTSLFSQTLANSRLRRYRNTSCFSALTLLFCAWIPPLAGVGCSHGCKQFKKNKLTGFWDSFADQILY